MKSLKYICMTMAATSALVCCHHADPEDTTEYLDGTFTFEIPSYVKAGDTVTLIPSGVTNPDGTGIGIYWSIDLLSVRDTVRLPDDPESVTGNYSFTVPDTTGTFTVSGGAFAPGYYSRTGSMLFTVVDPALNGSITGSGISQDDPSVTDSRDGAIYYYTSIGGLEWLRNNIAYTGSGRAYLDYGVLSYPLGRYYTAIEAREACPEGWRLPTDGEWTALEAAVEGDAGRLMADIYFNGSKMWEFWPEVKITGSSSLAILPAGFAAAGTFYGYEEYAAFWTGSDSPEDDEKACYRYINVNLPYIFTGIADKGSFAASVRCVRGTE